VLPAVTAVLVSVAALAAGALVRTGLTYARAARHRRHHPPPCAADDVALTLATRLISRARLLAGEAAATALPRLTAWLPWRPPPLSAATDRRRPVVLVPDVGAPRSSLRPLARGLARAGWRSIATVHLRLGRHQDVVSAIDALAAAIDGVRTATGARRVDVVAHGWGGLVARAYLGRAGMRVARLVTLGSPHQGTDAYPERSQALRPYLAGGDGHAERIAIYSPDDALLLPPENAYWPGAFNIQVRGIGHAALLRSSRVAGLVRENLAAPLESSAPAERDDTAARVSR
jgi:triacylglycerol lipase